MAESGGSAARVDARGEEEAEEGRRSCRSDFDDAFDREFGPAAFSS